jgi:GT2 family glycosyltransferase/glycosyltransferase involved in cell wall biosynthesis
MPLIDLSPGMTIGDPDVVVCVPLYGAHDEFKRCLRSLLRHTRVDVPILIADDADPDPAAYEWVRELVSAGALRHTVHWLRQERNQGFPGNCNAAFAASASADVAVVNSDCEVAAAWLEGLRAAAYVDTNVASATALTNNGTIVSVPYRNRPQASLPQDVAFELAAARVRELSPRLHPRIPTIVGHCFYVRRDALDLVGDFDETFAPGYGEEVDFSQRCVSMGLQHVVADDVFVLHRGGASLDADGAPHPGQARHEEIVRARYPWYEEAVASAQSHGTSPLARSIASARRALVGLRVTVDGRILTPSLTGTQVNTLEFIHALWRTRAARVRVVVPPQLGDYARHAFDAMEGIELVTREEALAVEPDDIVHRPYQATNAEDLVVMAAFGERIVLTQLDLIAYRNPAYFRAAKDWTRFRELTHKALALADLVLFCTEEGARDALAEGLIDDRRTRVVALGADHRLTEAAPEPREPPGTPKGLADAPFLLCLGTDFLHKNRGFALRVFEALRSRHEWEGRLVLAGPHVPIGSSGGDEAGWLALHEETAEHVVALPAIDEAEKSWLLHHATALLYPTTYEGFGFIPFEAAAAGLPCFFAHATSMADTLAGVTAVVKPWDAGATADAAIEYLRDERAQRRLVAELRSAAENHTWDRAASLTVDAYDHVVSMPPPSGRAFAQEALVLEAQRGEFEGRYWALRNQIGATGFTLVGESGRLPDDAQRALSALTKRTVTRRPLVAGLRLAHRVANPRRRAVTTETSESRDDAR